MCGIAGFSGLFPSELLDQMSNAIRHRGPDDAGRLVVDDQRVGLSHRRLAIIDTSPRGHQPMWNSTRTVAIVFNGEIYNFRDLQRELSSAGYEFRSQTDTEVLLNLYLRDGEQMFAALNGDYAFAIWDSRISRLLVARDEMGVKPFYFAETTRGFLFASEMKALLCEPTVDRTVDRSAIRSYLRYLWCPAPRTLLRGVSKLRPGHAMIVHRGIVEREWRFSGEPIAQPIVDMPKAAAVDELRSALRLAVHRQMVSDVPVGAFLSGGLDSSAVVAFAREVEPRRTLSCFTIDIDTNTGRREGFGSDLPYAQLVAHHLGVSLHTIRVGPEMADSFSTMVYHLDEPQADPAALNVLLISRLAREHGIKVLLSGAGGDDLFSGYRRHHALVLEKYWSWLPVDARWAMARAARLLPSRPASLRRLGKAFQHAALNGDARIASYFDWLEPQLVDSLLSENLRESSVDDSALMDSLAELPKEVPPLNRMLHLEMKHFLADHNLNYTDKMSMAAGVEVRVPFLDRDLVGFAASMPVSYKQRGAQGKWLLKRAMEGILPSDVIYRSKTGFGAPLREWMHGPLRELMNDTLSSETIRHRGWFDPIAVQRLILMDRDSKIDASYTIFSILAIELWGRMFIDRTCCD